MVHNDIQHRAALVHHGVQLRLHAGGVMLAGHLAYQAAGFPQDHIAPGSGGDIGSRRPQQSHISHHDLTADRELPGQGCGADRMAGIVERIQNGLTAFLGTHGGYLPAGCLDSSIPHWEKNAKKKESAMRSPF